MTEEEGVEVDATVIDVPAEITGAERWLAAKRGEVDRAMRAYGELTVETKEQYRDAKTARASLRKEIAAVESERKAATRAVDDALARFRDGCNALLEPMREREAQYKALIDAWDAKADERRTEALTAAYGEYAPALVPLVPFDALRGRFAKSDGWYLRSTPEPKACDMLRARLDEVARDWESVAALDATEDERSQVRSEYTRTLDLSAAIARMLDERARRAAVEEIAAQAEPQAEPQAEAGPEPQAEAGPEPQAVPDTETAPRPLGESVPWVVLIDAATPGQARDAGRALRSCGLSGSFRRLDAERYQRLVVWLNGR